MVKSRSLLIRDMWIWSERRTLGRHSFYPETCESGHEEKEIKSTWVECEVDIV